MSFVGLYILTFISRKIRDFDDLMLSTLISTSPKQKCKKKKEEDRSELPETLDDIKQRDERTDPPK